MKPDDKISKEEYNTLKGKYDALEEKYSKIQDRVASLENKFFDLMRIEIQSIQNVSPKVFQPLELLQSECIFSLLYYSLIHMIR